MTPPACRRQIELPLGDYERVLPRGERVRAKICSQGLTITALYQALTGKVLPPFLPWREKTTPCQVIQDRLLYCPDTGEKFDAIDLIVHCQGCDQRQATKLYLSMSGLKSRSGRKIAYNTAYSIMLGYLRLRTENEKQPWMHLSERWAQSSELSQKTRLRLVARLREEALQGKVPFFPVMISDTQENPVTGKKKTCWKILIGNLACAKVEQSLFHAQTDGRDKHIRLSVRDTSMSEEQLRSMIRALAAKWRPQKASPTPHSAPSKILPAKSQGDGHLGDNRGKQIEDLPHSCNTEASSEPPKCPPNRPKRAYHDVLHPKLMPAARCAMRKLQQTHYDNCKIHWSPAHAFNFVSNSLREGYLMESMIHAYTLALHKWHGLATDRGVKMVPSGLIADAKAIISQHGKKYVHPTRDPEYDAIAKKIRESLSRIEEAA
jgi:hypothetical protein